MAATPHPLPREENMPSPKLAQMCQPPTPQAQLAGKEYPGTYTMYAVDRARCMTSGNL